MSYTEKNLLSDEALIYHTHKHWVIFLLPVFWTVLGLIFSVQKDLLALLGYLLLFIALYYWISSVTNYMTSEYAITNKRVVIKIGFIQRQTWETLLSKIATLEVKQSIFGRMMRYGTLLIQSTGGGKDVFTVINDPLLFRRKVQQETEKMQANVAVPAAPTLIEQPSANIPPMNIEQRERL